MKQASDWHDALSALLPDMPDKECVSEPESEPSVTERQPMQRLRIDIERKGRSGKTATIISGFSLSDTEIAEIATTLKRKLGAGGSARGGEILIQGDRRDDVTRALRSLGIIK